jgi:hypothetical protein
MNWIYIVTNDRGKVVSSGKDICFFFFEEYWGKEEVYHAKAFAVSDKEPPLCKVYIEDYIDFLYEEGLYPDMRGMISLHEDSVRFTNEKSKGQTLHCLNALRYIWEVPEIVRDTMIYGDFIKAHIENKHLINYGHTNILQYDGVPVDYRKRIEEIDETVECLSSHMFDGVSEWIA